MIFSMQKFKKAYSKSRSAVAKVKSLYRRGSKETIYGLLRRHYGYEQRSNKLRVAIILSSGVETPRSSSFIRLFSPLTSAPIGDNIYLKVFGENTSNIGSDFDVCIVQRTALDNTTMAKVLIENLKSSKIPLIVDSDDAFDAIDQSHPEYEILNQKKKALELLVKNADCVWVSTARLTNYYANVNQKPIVIRNSLDQRLWINDQRKNIISEKLELVYMGTATHDSDFEMIYPALSKLNDKYPNSFNLTVVGVSKKLPDKHWIKRISPASGSVYPEFVKWFVTHSSYDIGLSPLVDNAFNQGKSDIKCLDYIAAGIVPLVSDVEPYASKDLDNLVIRTKNTTEDWYKALSGLVSNLSETRRDNRKRIAQGQKYIWRERSADKTGQMLFKHLKELAGKK